MTCIEMLCHTCRKRPRCIQGDDERSPQYRCVKCTYAYCPQCSYTLLGKRYCYVCLPVPQRPIQTD